MEGCPYHFAYSSEGSYKGKKVYPMTHVGIRVALCIELSDGIKVALSAPLELPLHHSWNFSNMHTLTVGKCLETVAFPPRSEFTSMTATVAFYMEPRNGCPESSGHYPMEAVPNVILNLPDIYYSQKYKLNERTDDCDIFTIEFCRKVGGFPLHVGVKKTKNNRCHSMGFTFIDPTKPLLSLDGNGVPIEGDLALLVVNYFKSCSLLCLLHQEGLYLRHPKRKRDDDQMKENRSLEASKGKMQKHGIKMFLKDAKQTERGNLDILMIAIALEERETYLV